MKGDECERNVEGGMNGHKVQSEERRGVQNARRVDTRGARSAEYAERKAEGMGYTVWETRVRRDGENG